MSLNELERLARSRMTATGESLGQALAALQGHPSDQPDSASPGAPAVHAPRPSLQLAEPLERDHDDPTDGDPKPRKPTTLRWESTRE